MERDIFGLSKYGWRSFMTKSFVIKSSESIKLTYSPVTFFSPVLRAADWPEFF